MQIIAQKPCISDLAGIESETQNIQKIFCVHVAKIINSSRRNNHHTSISWQSDVWSTQLSCKPFSSDMLNDALPEAIPATPTPCHALPSPIPRPILSAPSKVFCNDKGINHQSCEMKIIINLSAQWNQNGIRKCTIWPEAITQNLGWCDSMHLNFSPPQDD